MKFFLIIISFLIILKVNYTFCDFLTEEEKRNLPVEKIVELLKNTNKLRQYLETNGHNTVTDEATSNFIKFILKYKKNHSSGMDTVRRFEVFCENMFKIELFRLLEIGSAKYGVTQFSDLTVEEFHQKMSGMKPKPDFEDYTMEEVEIPDIPLPENFDWREHKAVTHVKNQGDCASCYAFSVVGNIEGLYSIKNDELLVFSEQEILDCDTYDFGCRGGYMIDTYRAIEDLGGLEEQEEYGPYLEYPVECHFNKTNIKIKIESHKNISHNETEMAQWLVGNGPFSMGLNDFGMQFYYEGVQNLRWCDPTDINHGMVMVGFGVEKGEEKEEPYWIIKNSWGEHFGEQGYYRIARGVGMCGLNEYVTTAIL